MAKIWTEEEVSVEAFTLQIDTGEGLKDFPDARVTAFNTNGYELSFWSAEDIDPESISEVVMLFEGELVFRFTDVWCHRYEHDQGGFDYRCLAVKWTR
jgi:hypothetical protein